MEEINDWKHLKIGIQCIKPPKCPDEECGGELMYSEKTYAMKCDKCGKHFISYTEMKRCNEKGKLSQSSKDEQSK